MDNTDSKQKRTMAIAGLVTAALIAVPALGASAYPMQEQQDATDAPKALQVEAGAPEEQPIVYETEKEPEAAPFETEPETPPLEDEVTEKTPVPSEPNTEPDEDSLGLVISIETHQIETTIPKAEPAAPTTDEPTEAHAGVAAQQVFENNVNTVGVAGDINDYDNYLHDLEAVGSNPVFAALFASEEARQFDIVEVSAWDNTQYAHLAVNGLSDNWVDSSVTVSHDGDHPNDTDSMFSDQYGVQTNYMVDGIEVQKYYERDVLDAMGYDTPDEPMPNPDHDQEIAWINFTERRAYTYWERVNVTGDWYLVYGENEAEVDTIATALAHIAAQM